MELSDYWDTVNGFIDNGDDGFGHNVTKIKPGTKLISISSARSAHQVELPGLSALPEHRRIDAGRCRGDAAVADRSGEVGDLERPQGCDGQARRRHPRRPTPRGSSAPSRRPPSPGTRVPINTARLVHGDLRADQGSRLVAGLDLRQYQQLGEPAVADGEAPSVARLRRAATASAMARRRRSARRSATATSAASRSRSSPTAI